MARRENRPSAAGPTVRRRVRVRGIVQGVGFRPTVYRLAVERGLGGWVLNDAEGVLIELEGPEAGVDSFVSALARDPPPLARITAIESESLAPLGEREFRIAPSAAGRRVALVSPDMATCDDCRRELLDPADRRYRYPFINCTNCGPRYSIMLDIPYDRPATTMRGFTMCAECQAEYDDPADRRFHAQPNACPVCGPRLALHGADGRPVACPDAVAAVREALLAGRIVAVKGLTGFHLAADARSDAAVRELRRRKGRDEKPFAMMAASAEAVARRARVGEAERALLESRERPIVLVAKRPDHDLSPGVAPRSPYFGFMLPYAPVHYLLFEDLPADLSAIAQRATAEASAKAGDFPPMILTSGNLAEEPICGDNTEAVRRLEGIADLFLVHDRPIQTVCDDSVAMVQRSPGSARVPARRDFAEATPGAPGLPPALEALRIAFEPGRLVVATRVGGGVGSLVLSQHLVVVPTPDGRLRVETAGVQAGYLPLPSRLANHLVRALKEHVDRLEAARPDDPTLAVWRGVVQALEGEPVSLAGKKLGIALDAVQIERGVLRARGHRVER
ncbi:MAG: Sua5/YciO/YrdC/YwlC family protein [Planctomycetota bacterium]|nr:Sua5/YciO/YrdC/YwlC family protein [Planctomycetota bacterium]